MSTPSASDAPDGGRSSSGRRWPGPRVRTIVFGLVMLAIGVISLLRLLIGLRVDGATFGMVLLVAAGTALLAGGLASALRDVRRGR